MGSFVVGVPTETFPGEARVALVPSAMHRLSDAGITTRGEPIDGIGGRQALIEDASANPIELFEPASRG